MNDAPVPIARALCFEGHIPTLRRSHGSGPDLACQPCFEAARAAGAAWGGYGTIPTPMRAVTELDQAARIVVGELLRELGAMVTRDPVGAAELALDLARRFAEMSTAAVSTPEIAAPLEKLAGLFRRAAVLAAKVMPLPDRRGS